MKRVLALLAAVLMISATAVGAFAAKSPMAAPEDEDSGKNGGKNGENGGKTSPNTSYSIMAEVGAVAAVVSCSAAGIVLSKKVD